jgi:Zn-dependent protease
MITVLLIAILVVSVVLHELAHGLVADRLGDPTARLAGRLTLNPLPHLDPVGSVLLPAALAVSGSSFLFGWAKPVPFNPLHLRDRRWGPALVGVAGPLANVLLAAVAALGVRHGVPGTPVLQAVVVINLVLAVFNLIPIPPLDGSRLVSPVLPRELRRVFARVERVGMVLVVGLVYFYGGRILSPPVRFLYRALTG